MKDKLNKNIEIKEFEGDIYLEKGGIIADKFCPECKKVILRNQKFCDCGYFIKASNNSKVFLRLVLAFILFVGGLGMLGSFGVLPFSGMVKSADLKKFDLSSLSPINIQLISSLNSTPYRKYIQNIYILPNRENEAVVLVRPSLWHLLKKKDKEIILKTVSQKWSKLFFKKNPKSDKKPAIKFGNLD